MKKTQRTGHPLPETRRAEGFRETPWPYEDIVHLPHHVSGKHPPMSMSRRAAQFAPFAALTGYDDAIAETARRTEEKTELAEDAAEELDRGILAAAAAGSEIVITRFLPDSRKSGGQYLNISGRIMKIKTDGIIMENGEKIPLTQILAIHAR